MNKTIEISSGTILRTIFILLALWFLFLVRDIVALVFVAIIITSAIDPIVDWFQKRRIPRALTVLVVYVLFISIVSTAVGFLIPPLAAEIRSLGENFPQLAEKLSGYFRILRDYAVSYNLQQHIAGFTASVAEKISQAGSSLLGGTVSFIGGIFEFVVILSIAFYMSVQEKGIKKFFASLMPEEHREYISGLVERIQFKMGRWLQGQLLLMFLVFALDYLGLLLIGAPYALILALVSGLLEIVPYIGPVISAIIATTISFLHGPLTGLLVLGLFVLVQQLEGYVLTPLVMKKAVGLNPVVVILALLIGAKLGGVLGIIVAVPIATVLGEVVSDLTKKEELEKSG
jgi:predicted PurR-regulated permease PerM